MKEVANALARLTYPALLPDPAVNFGLLAPCTAARETAGSAHEVRRALAKLI